MTLNVKTLNFFGNILLGSGSIGVTVTAGAIAYGLISSNNTSHLFSGKNSNREETSHLPFKIAMIQSVATAVISTYLITPIAKSWSKTGNQLTWKGWAVGHVVSSIVIVALPILFIKGYEKYSSKTEIETEKGSNFKEIILLSLCTVAVQVPHYISNVRLKAL